MTSKKKTRTEPELLLGKPGVHDNLARRDPWHDPPELSQEFAETLVDREASTTEAAGSPEPSIPEPLPKVESGNHDVFTQFPKDRNCEVCRRTKITWAPCRKRSGRHIHRVEICGDLTTANRKLLNELCESRNSHRYAVIVQESATQWLTKTPQKTEMSLPKFLEPKADPKVTHTQTIQWNLATPLKIYHGITVLQRLIVLKHMVLQSGKCAG